MKSVAIFLFSIFFTILLTPSIALAQEATPPVTPAPTQVGFNPELIVQGFSLAFFITLLTTLIAGAIGGIVYELLILQGNIEKPHTPTKEELAEKYPYGIGKFLYDLGILARIIIGALAAVAALLVLSPTTTFGLLATAVVAGSAGTSIFRSLQDRMLAVVAQKDAEDTKEIADKQDALVVEAGQAFAELKDKLQKASTSQAGTKNLTIGDPQGPALTLDPGEIDKVEHLLEEAKGIHKAL